MNIKQKILGIPLIYLMVIGIASAAVIGAITYANIQAIGSYQAELQSRGFSIEDGDTDDPVTYEIDGNNVFLSFPLYINQSEGVGYTKVLKIVPDGTVSNLSFSNVKRTGNGILSAQLGFYEETAPGIGYVDIPLSPTSYTFPVLGNHVYYVDLMISTGSPTGITETISFKISKV
jgi:hypothetical protein